MVLVALPLFTRNTPMRNDGTATYSLAMGIRILHRRRCTGGLWRATRPRTITRYWAKSPRNFETLIPPACGRASPFRGCINTNKSTGKRSIRSHSPFDGQTGSNPPWAKARVFALTLTVYRRTGKPHSILFCYRLLAGAVIRQALEDGRLFPSWSTLAVFP